MKLLILVSLIAAVAADTIASYSPPKHSGHGSGASGLGSGVSGLGSGVSGLGSGASGLGSGASGLGFASAGSGIGGISVGSGGGCGPGQVRHVDGSCVTPVVTRNTYFYAAPAVAPIVGPRPPVPPPRIEQNVIFVHAPETFIDQQTLIVPPPQQTNTLYVLHKRPEVNHDVIHVPGGEQETPEVFFVSYKEGDDLTLPTGEKLQDALSVVGHGGGPVIDHGVVGDGVGIGGGVGVVVGGGIGGGGGSYGVTTPTSLYSAP